MTSKEMAQRQRALERGAKENQPITYRAVVKYEVRATDKEKLRALREGLQEIVVEMVEEQGVTLEYIESALDDALSVAQDSIAYREQWERTHPKGEVSPM